MDIGSLMNSPDDLGKVLHFLVEKVAGLMHADACSLFLYDPETKELTLKATFGLNTQMVDHVVIQSGVGLTGKTIELAKPISIADAKASDYNVTIKDLGEDEFKAFLSVPLLYNADPIGVVVVQNRESRKFSKKDVDFLLTLSIPAVNVIEKARFMGTMGSLNKTAVLETTAPEEEVASYAYLKDHFIKGIPAVRGISMGKLKIVKNRLARRHDTANKQGIKEEIDRLQEAFVKVSDEIRETKKQAEAKFGPDEASIFEAYLLFLESASFQQQIIAEIKKGLSAVNALERIVAKYMDRMAMAHDEYIKERAYDIQDVARKISDHLLYGETVGHNKFEASEPTIFLNEFWSISDFVNLSPQFAKGIISPTGGASSHISILADTLNLPAVLGLGVATQQLKDDDYVIIDGFSGTVIVNPSKATIDVYTEELEDLEKRKLIFQSYKNQRVYLAKGGRHFFPIGANLGMVAHIGGAVDSGADMVGLYRTEFPFLVRKSMPTEEDQYLIYKRVLDLMKGKEVVFRTLDIGGDKYVTYLNLPKESNPALGWRAIRFSLERKDLFRIQLRALLRASVHGKIKILIPMVSGVEQIREVREVLDSVRRELTDENISYVKKIPLGAMIEVPSAVEIADKLAREVDFFSIGTNDLVQYLLAVDRTNPLVAPLYDPFHPAVIKTLNRTIVEAHKRKIKVNLCGDIASNPYLAVVLVGLGIDSLSMIPRSVPVIKHLARTLKESAAVKLAKACLTKATSAETKQLVEDFFEEHNLKEFIHTHKTPPIETPES